MQAGILADLAKRNCFFFCSASLLGSVGCRGSDRIQHCFGQNKEDSVTVLQCKIYLFYTCLQAHATRHTQKEQNVVAELLE